jgi:hypothetical protein
MGGKTSASNVLSEKGEIEKNIHKKVHYKYLYQKQTALCVCFEIA